MFWHATNEETRQVLIENAAALREADEFDQNSQVISAEESQESVTEDTATSSDAESEEDELSL